MEGKTNFCLCPSHKEMLSKMTVRELKKMMKFEKTTFRDMENIISISHQIVNSTVSAPPVPLGEGGFSNQNETLKELKRANENRAALIDFIKEEISSREKSNE